MRYVGYENFAYILSVDVEEHVIKFKFMVKLGWIITDNNFLFLTLFFISNFQQDETEAQVDFDITKTVNKVGAHLKEFVLDMKRFLIDLGKLVKPFSQPPRYSSLSESSNKSGSNINDDSLNSSLSEDSVTDYLQRYKTNKFKKSKSLYSFCLTKSIRK